MGIEGKQGCLPPSAPGQTLKPGSEAGLDQSRRAQISADPEVWAVLGWRLRWLVNQGGTGDLPDLTSNLWPPVDAPPRSRRGGGAVVYF